MRVTQRAEQLLPRVSVVMVVRNEAPWLEQCLRAAFAQDYPADRLEIIVSDGMSTDATRETLATLQTQHGNLTIIDNPQQAPAAGLNAAIRAAQGEYIVRLDPRAVIESDYVRHCVEVLQQTGTDNVTGKMVVVREGASGKSLLSAIRSRFGIGGGMFPYYNEDTRTFTYYGEEPRADAVYLSAWRRDLFAHIGLFDEALGRNHDDGLNLRLLENRGRLLLSPAIKSVYHTRTTLASICRQYFDYGFWRVRLVQRHRWHLRPRQLVSPILIGVLLMSLLGAEFSATGMGLFCGVAGLLFVANCGISLLTARRAGLRQFPRLFVTFAAMHLSYGSGFLAGLVRFANRWRDKGHFEKLTVDQPNSVQSADVGSAAALPAVSIVKLPQSDLALV